MNELMVKEYLGNKIEFKVIDGMVYAKANTMCDSVKLDNWKRSSNTKRYVEALRNKASNNTVKITEFIKSEEGVKGGTWIHEKLILNLARYVSVEFEIWCDDIIAELLREGTVTIKPKSEEDMLLELFPSSDQNLIMLTAQNIRQVKALTQEVIHKEDVIIGLVDNIDLATKRQRITQIVRYKSKNYQDRYNLLYSEFQKKYHLDLNRRMESCTLKPKVRNKMDYIDRVMNMIPELYEICCKLFENSVENLRKEWESTIEN